MTASIAPSQPAELEGIKDVRDLPGDWLVNEWSTFEASEAQSLAETLQPWIAKLLQGDEAEFDALVHEKGFWRDLVCLSWTFRTFHGKEWAILTLQMHYTAPSTYVGFVHHLQKGR